MHRPVLGEKGSVADYKSIKITAINKKANKILLKSKNASTSSFDGRSFSLIKVRSCSPFYERLRIRFKVHLQVTRQEERYLIPTNILTSER